MENKDYKKKVSFELKNLTRKQVLDFAWRCSIYALPFVGNKGNFDLWKKEIRQKFLYSIFYTLDVFAANNVTSAVKTYSDIVSTTSVEGYDSSKIEDTSYLSCMLALTSIAEAISAFISNDPKLDTIKVIDHTIKAASLYNINLELVILDELKNILASNRNSFIGIDLYSNIWNNFQKALETEGCGYWGKLYKNIFDNGFVLDKEALESRLNVPKEIQEQGATAVANYLEELEKGAMRFNEARLIILGDKGAGKTCLARRLINPDAAMTTDDESTAGVDTLIWKLKKEGINIHIWDFAGHTVTHAVHQFFLSERCLYIIVYDGRTEERNRLEYWLNHMKNFGGDSKAIILVNKRDQHSVNIPINSLKEQYSIDGYFTFSIQDNKEGLEAFRCFVLESIKNNPSWNNQSIPTNYFKVKEELEELFVKGKKKECEEFIRKKDFEKIAKFYNVDNTEELLKNLHALGISLWYKDMEEFDTLVLNPEWISHGVYKIINWVNERKKYSLTLDDFLQIFQEDSKRYPNDKFEYIFKLMIRYELAYKTKEGNCLIIPHLLKEDRPERLPEYPIEESLMLRYKAEQPLPPNTISRFIVRHNQEIKFDGKNFLVWRYGVVLEVGKSTVALVREEDRTISVSVKGPNKTAFISLIRESLNDIFSSYKSKKPDLQYRVERYGKIPEDIELKHPLWLSDRKIFVHSKQNEPYFEEITGQRINMYDTVFNYNITAETLIGEKGHQIIYDNSRNSNIIFNFSSCNIGLQGNLNDLAQLLSQNGNDEEAKELENTAKVLEQIEQYNNPDEVKKKGITSKLKRLVLDLGDEKSKLHKTVEGIKHGIGIAQDIAKGYNDIAQWVGLPQVPKPFLKK